MCRHEIGLAVLMDNSRVRQFQFGFRAVLWLMTGLSVCFALAARGQWRTVVFLLCMPLWCWACISITVKCVIFASYLVDALGRRR